MRYKIIIYLFITALIACNNKDASEEIIETTLVDQISFTKQQIKLAEIKSGSIEKQFLSLKINCKGRILAKPQNRAKISVPKAGYVHKIMIENGQAIKKESSMLVLIHPDYIKLQKEYLQVKSRYNFVEKEYNRQKILSENKAGTGKNLEKAKNEYEELSAERMALKLELQLLHINADKLTTDNIRNSITVTAPISGNVNEIAITIGQYVSPEDVLFEVINNKDFIIELQVFERDIHKINIGQVVGYECSMPESRDSNHFAKITHIGNYVDETTKTFKVQAKPDKCILGMRHGIFLDAHINLNNQKVSVLPENAVFNDGNQTYVFTIVSDTIFKKQPIETGMHETGFYEIINPENITKNIVINGGNYIVAEMNKE